MTKNIKHICWFFLALIISNYIIAQLFQIIIPQPQLFTLSLIINNYSCFGQSDSTLTIISNNFVLIIILSLKITIVIISDN